jgi:predicted enzyme related to lactoylglutathione lyase
MATTKRKQQRTGAKKAKAHAKPKAKPSVKAEAPARSKAKAKPAARSKAKPAARSKAKAETAMFKKVAFTLFPVEDSTRARAFYEDVLGLTRGLAASNGMWTEYDLPGGGCLALFRHPDPKQAAAPGGASVAFEVADLDALNERLRAAGVRYQGELVHGPHCRMSNILDSEGNAIILHQLAR